MPTPNLGLTQPSINPTYDLWGAAMNNNLALIDTASTKLRGTLVSATVPTTGQALIFNGTSWAPAAVGAGSITGGGAAGQIAFFSSGTAILSDGALRWDNTLKNLGIGVAPLERLDIDGPMLVRGPSGFGSTVASSGGMDHAGTDLRIVSRGPDGSTNGGFVFISTAGDGSNIVFPFSISSSGIDVAGDFSVSAAAPAEIAYHTAIQRLGSDTIFWYGGGVGDLVIKSGAVGGGGDRLMIKQNGNVGFGNVVPGYRVDVNGDVNVTGTFRIGGAAATYTGAPNTLMSRDGTGGTTVSYLNATSLVTQTLQITSGGAQGLVLTSDASGNATWQAVASIQGVDVSATAPTAGQILKLVGGVWTPSSDLGLKQDLADKGQPSGYAALDGSGKVPQAQLPAVAITDTFVVADQAGRLALVAQTGDVAIQQDVATTFILRGTNPAVNADWEQLLFPNTGVQSVTGTAPISIGGTLINPIVAINAATALLQGSTRMSLAPASALDPIAVGDNDPRVANVAHGSGTIGKLPKWTAGTVVGDSILSESGSIVTSTGDLNVTGIYRVGGVQIASANLSDVATLIKTTTTLGGDLSGNLPNATVAKVNGVAVTGTPTVGQTIVATSGTAATWQTPAAASALKTSGADVVISAAAPPTAGQVLTATSATVATWQTPSGGAGGFATAVVAAPTGNATTDTAAINTALTTAAAGGSVVLRGGTYAISSMLTIGANITLMGMGKATILQAASGLGANPILTVSGARACIKDLSIDLNFAVRGAQATNDIVVSGANVIFDSVRTLNTTSTGNGTTFFFNSQSADESAATQLIACEFALNGNTPSYFFGCKYLNFTNCIFNINASVGQGIFVERSAGYFIGVHNCNFFVAASPNNLFIFFNSSGSVAIVGNSFFQSSGTTNQVLNVQTSGAYVSFAANVSKNINIGAVVGAGKTVISGNAGFASYTGGTQVGNVS